MIRFEPGVDVAEGCLLWDLEEQTAASKCFSSTTNSKVAAVGDRRPIPGEIEFSRSGVSTRARPRNMAGDRRPAEESRHLPA